MAAEVFYPVVLITVCGVCCYFISKLKRRVRELEIKAGEADRLLQLRGTLSREIAHEIKNPISAILCSVETLDLLLRDQISGTQHQILRGIKDYGDSLLHLVSDFLEVSMAESGVTKVEKEPLALAQIVPGVCSLLRSVAARKSITLDSKGDPRAMVIEADPRHLKQILFNLIQNAIKFTPEGGNITVQTVVDPAEELVTIAVHDTGCGIPDDKIESMFQLYERVENPAHDVEGYGVGLYLCKLLVELSGGTISVESVEGVGSSFYITFPCYRIQDSIEASDKIREAVVSDAQPFKGERLLVLDNNDGHCKSMETLLLACGAMVETVNDAIDAIELLSTHHYDLLFINGEFDGGVGYELPRLIRKDLGNAQLNIVVVAKNARLSRKALERGANQVVLKPFSGKVVLDSIVSSMSSKEKETRI